MDDRLTKEMIRSRRAALKNDDRISLRGSNSDSLEQAKTRKEGG